MANRNNEEGVRYSFTGDTTELTKATKKAISLLTEYEGAIQKVASKSAFDANKTSIKRFTTSVNKLMKQVDDFTTSYRNMGKAISSELPNSADNIVRAVQDIEKVLNSLKTYGLSSNIAKLSKQELKDLTDILVVAKERFESVDNNAEMLTFHTYDLANATRNLLAIERSTVTVESQVANANAKIASTLTPLNSAIHTSAGEVIRLQEAYKLSGKSAAESLYTMSKLKDAVAPVNTLDKQIELLAKHYIDAKRGMLGLQVVSGDTSLAVQKLSTSMRLFREHVSLAKRQSSDLATPIYRLTDGAKRLGSGSIPGATKAARHFTITIIPLLKIINALIYAFKKFILACKIAKGVIVGTTKAVTKFFIAVNKLGGSLLSLCGHLKKANSATRLLGSSMKYISGLAIGKAFANATKQAISYTENQNLFQVAMGESIEAGTEFIGKMQELYGMDPSNLMRYAGNFYQLSDAIDMPEESAKNLALVMTKATNDIASLFNVDIDTVFENMSSGMQGMSRAVRKYGMDIRITTLQQTALNLGIQRNVATMSEADRIGLRFITMMQQASNASGDFARTIETPANQLRILKEQISQFGRAVATFFIVPLRNAVQVINGFIMALRTVLNWVAKITGIFRKVDNISGNTGSSMAGIADSTKEATKSAQGLGGATSGVGKAAKKAAKDVKDMLAPFDELNVFKADEASDSGAGDAGGGGGAGGMGSDVLDPAIADAIAKMDSDFEEIYMKANKVRDAILEFLGFKVDMGEIISFDREKFEKSWFEQLPEMAKTFGQNLGRNINSAISRIPWEETGEILGAGIKSATTFLWWTIETTDWVNLGKSIAHAVNGAVSKIDWKIIGKLMFAKFKIAIETLAGFIVGLKAGKLAKAAHDLMIGFVEAIQGTIDSIDWAGVTHNLLEFVDELDLYEVGEKLAEAFDSLVEQVNWEEVGELLCSGFQLALDLLAGFFENVDMVEFAKGATNVALGFLNALSDAIKKVNWTKIGEQVRDLIANIDWNSLFESLFEVLGLAIGSLFQLLGGLLDELVGGVHEWFTEKMDENGGGVINAFCEGILEVLHSIGTWIYEHVFTPFFNGICEAFGIENESDSTIMESVGQILMNSIKQGLEEKFPGLYAKVSELWERVKTWYQEHVKPKLTKQYWIDQLDGIKQGIKDTLNGIIEKVETAINRIIDKINSVKFSFPDWIPGLGGKSFSTHIPKVSIPRLASGGVVDKPTYAMIGEGQHSEAVVPLDNSPQMQQLVKQIADAVSSREGNTNQPIEVHVNIGNREWDAFTYESSRRGERLIGAQPIKEGRA